MGKGACVESGSQNGLLCGTARDGILIVDSREAIVVEADPFLTELLGCSREELLGRPVREIFSLGNGLQAESLVEKVRVEGYVRFDELPLSTRDGRRIVVELVGSSYQVDERTMLQFNVCDVTERRRE